MRKKLLTPEQAFQAMFAFLSAYYERTGGTADLGEVLGDIQQTKDGSTMDPAAWGDWLAAIDAVFAEAKKL